MRTVYLLDGNDIIKKGDVCRPLSRMADHSQHVSEWCSTGVYSGKPCDTFSWTDVENYLSDHWIGKRVDDYNNPSPPVRGPKLEFMRRKL